MSAWLLDRAESYWRDAMTFRAEGDVPMAVAYETISRELRVAAEDLRNGGVGEPTNLGDGPQC